MRKMIAILFGLALVCTMNSGRVPDAGICLGNDEAKGDVLFIFDTSGSMGEAGGVDPDGNVLSRLQVARFNFAPRLARATRHAGGIGNFAALVLGRSPRCSEPKREVEWGAANEAKVDEISVLLNKLRPDDMTPLVRAFQITRRELRDKDNPRIVLVSDGLETCQKTPELNIQILLDEASKIGAGEALKALPGVYVVFFVPTLQPRPGTALAGVLKELLKKLEFVGRNMKANMIALVNTVEGFGEALEGAVIEGLDPAPAELGLGRLHTTKVIGHSLRVSVYITDGLELDPRNNGDGVLDPGETIQINFRCINLLDSHIENLELRYLRTNHAQIGRLETGDPVTLGTLEPDGQVFTSPYEILIRSQESVKAGNVFKILVDVMSNGSQLGSLEFWLEVGSLLTPVQYPKDASPLMIGFSDGSMYINRKPAEILKILLSGNPGQAWHLMWGTTLTGDRYNDVELALGEAAVVLSEGVLGEAGSDGPVDFHVPDPGDLAEGKVFFQAVSVDPGTGAITVSNVITLDVETP